MRKAEAVLSGGEPYRGARAPTMRVVGAAVLGALLVAGCGSKQKGVFGRNGPDEFRVARRAPLVIPPDYAMSPPRPGAPRPQEADSSTQALQALFGGPATRSGTEQSMLGSAGRAPDAGVRSNAGDPATTVVDKGAATRDILAAPAGPGQDAQATAPK